MTKLIHTKKYDLINSVRFLCYQRSLEETCIFFTITGEFSKIEDFRRRAIVNNTPILMKLLHLSKNKEERAVAKKWHTTYINLIDSLGEDYCELLLILESKFQNENENINAKRNKI
jgi:hypothetical protein